MAEQVEFELVSPEKLLVSDPVDMVVVPGADGDFGVLPRHAPLLSTVRPGVISVYEVPVEDIDRADAEQKLKDAREDLQDAKDERATKAAETAIAVYEEMLKVSN